MFLKPAPGLKVPDLMLRDFLPEEGRDVVPSEYWTRRLLDGDVVEAEPEAEPEASEVEAAPTATDTHPAPPIASAEMADEAAPVPAEHEETQP